MLSPHQKLAYIPPHRLAQVGGGGSCPPPTKFSKGKPWTFQRFPLRSFIDKLLSILSTIYTQQQSCHIPLSSIVKSEAIQVYSQLLVSFKLSLIVHIDRCVGNGYRSSAKCKYVSLIVLLLHVQCKCIARWETKFILYNRRRVQDEQTTLSFVWNSCVLVLVCLLTLRCSCCC